MGKTILNDYIVFNTNNEVVGDALYRHDAINLAKRLAKEDPNAYFYLYKRDCDVWSSVEVHDNLPQLGVTEQEE